MPVKWFTKNNSFGTNVDVTNLDGVNQDGTNLEIQKKPRIVP
jgi:hypothetical protein